MTGDVTREDVMLSEASNYDLFEALVDRSLYQAACAVLAKSLAYVRLAHAITPSELSQSEQHTLSSRLDGLSDDVSGMWTCAMLNIALNAADVSRSGIEEEQVELFHHAMKFVLMLHAGDWAPGDDPNFRRTLDDNAEHQSCSIRRRQFFLRVLPDDDGKLLDEILADTNLKNCHEWLAGWMLEPVA